MRIPAVPATIMTGLALLSASAASAAPAVDFGYAFGYPHRITVALPDSGDKTLVDCSPGQVALSWTYGNLLNIPPATFDTPVTQWHVVLKPEVDGAPYQGGDWRRAEGWLPVLSDSFTGSAVNGRMEIVGTARAAVVRMEFTNHDPARSHRAGIDCTVPGHWLGVNPHFVDPTDPLRPRDVLIAGWKDRTDRVLIFGTGAPEYAGFENTLYPAVTLAPGETRVLWLVRPYEAYLSMLPELRRRDWAAEFEGAKEVWRRLIGPAARLSLADPGVRNAYYAGLADIFIMREPVGHGYIGTTPGTEMYRGANPCESAIAGVCLDQAGLDVEALTGYRLSLDMQAFDGCWAEPEGWAHDCWFSSGLKSWFVMEHYLDTRDRGFLASIFPHMMASTRWQGRERERTRILVDGRRTADYGLLPPGMGDAGLMNGKSLYGVFIPHNIWALYGDALTVQAAEALGLSREAGEARGIFEKGRADLLATIRGGAIQENGYRWIPGVAGKTSGSRWGALNAAFPCRLLAPDDELITGTIRKMESKMSPGGIPIHTGWMEDGMWVAITLDNLAETLLMRGDGDSFAKYLYATLNHGTPLYSWCEERGPEPGAKKTSGDRQHLWTPVAVVRAIRDSLVFEDGSILHLARGADRSWIGRGPVGGEGLRTHFGPVSYRLEFDGAAGRVSGAVTLAPGRPPATLVVHVRLPSGAVLRGVSDPAARIVEGGSALEWKDPPLSLHFTADVGR